MVRAGYTPLSRGDAEAHDPTVRHTDVAGSRHRRRWAWRRTRHTLGVKAAPGTERLVTPTFTALLTACVWYFLSTGMMLVAVPVFVTEELGGGAWGVGAAIGVSGLAAALLRVVAGPITDTKGRRWVMVFGSTIAGLSMLGLVVAGSVGVVVVLRALTGIGEAAFFVGAATALQDIAPEGRRAEATSYFSAVVYASMALGPLLAEWLIERFSFGVTWLAGAAFCGIGSLLALRAPQNRVPGPALSGLRSRPVLHPAAVGPGTVLVIGLLGFACFMTFAALWATEVGIGRAGNVFLLFAGSVLILRLLLARLPDRIGARTTTTIALVLSALGLAVMATWQAPGGAYVGSLVMAIGQSFLFPALFALVIQTAPAAERGQAVASFSISFDVAFGIGGFIAGAVATHLGGIPSAFWFGAAACVLALIVARAALPRTAGEILPVGDVPRPPRAGPDEVRRLRGS